MFTSLLVSLVEFSHWFSLVSILSCFLLTASFILRLLSHDLQDRLAQFMQLIFINLFFQIDWPRFFHSHRRHPKIPRPARHRVLGDANRGPDPLPAHGPGPIQPSIFQRSVSLFCFLPIQSSALRRGQRQELPSRPEGKSLAMVQGSLLAREPLWGRGVPGNQRPPRVGALWRGESALHF